MSLTASLGHSFHTVFDHVGHLHPPAAREAHEVVADLPDPEPPRRTPADVGAKLARREPVVSGDLVRTTLVGFNLR